MNVIKSILSTLLKFFVFIAVISLMCVVGFISYLNWQAYKPLTTKKFNSDKWKLAEIEKDIGGFPDLKKRCGMYRDLTRNHLKKGLSIQEVESLLGPIDSWSYCKDKRIKCYDYVMGVCYSSGIFVVPMSLFTCFDNNNKLISFDTVKPCKTIGTYFIKTKEQYCSKTDHQRGGISIPTNECGIEPW